MYLRRRNSWLAAGQLGGTKGGISLWTAVESQTRLLRRTRDPLEQPHFPPKGTDGRRPG